MLQLVRDPLYLPLFCAPSIGAPPATGWDPVLRHMLNRALVLATVRREVIEVEGAGLVRPIGEEYAGAMSREERASWEAAAERLGLVSYLPLRARLGLAVRRFVRTLNGKKA